ncbi:hypothetical protein MOO46_01775 [Apilactobacillus apisilvae]|uniref:Uncharacterized protein n=1 Tax=Apilactobacillus apisilvae TaxID=2923364 RepID=A0ABY4PI69_9LACO|nr:hypothetical protein [Apilactobacillus apisilvae]UQS85345.1 hypothetical protein MOO46_01775 [Apilactobacillus apisilvae]
MRNLLKPKVLVEAVNRDLDFKNAIAVLKDKISDEYDENPLYSNKISAHAIILAKNIEKNGIVKSKIDFTNYQSVHSFIVKNDLYLKMDAKNELLNKFK